MNAKKRKINVARRLLSPEQLPQPLPPEEDQRLVRVYVEGYEDVAFWRGIFDHFRNPYLRFEISVPNREDLPKGKKVLLNMIPRSGPDLLLCADSDFDYLFGGRTEQSATVAAARYLFHTYAYATENYLCYAPSLHNVCVKATKNDTRIFDFVVFLREYSRTIYPLFVWYAYSAQLATEHVFTLIDFKASVRLGYLDIADNGARTLEWLARNVEKRERLLRQRNPRMIEPMKAFEEQLCKRGLTPETTYLFMHGHTLMDNVVMVLLNSVCEKLRQLSIAKITSSKKEGVALRNEMSNYTNSLRSIRDVLLDNENYTRCPLYKRLQRDIQKYIVRTIIDMKRNGEIHDDSYWTILQKLREDER
ncbi:MAG: DUF4435 domain-containing protein [Alistipes sp.]|nr:DUF4435 domain-containing protein [Alistipes senegalensis]MCM1251051.1 DUF4435 domain-containing protein [Alistipes sp.]